VFQGENRGVSEPSIRPTHFDRGDADPAGDDQADRVAVVGWQGLAVHLVREQDAGEGLADRHRAADRAEVDAAGDVVRVEADRLHVDSVAAEAGQSEHGRQPYAPPAGDADGAQPPRRARDGLALLGGVVAAAIAGALEGDRPGFGG
jgi:hypothetical protein